MADVFLSYSSKDRPAAERVQQALTARGLDVFWDQETPPGQDWDTWIRSKLSICKVAVVLWSRTSVKSDNVRHEALVARKAKKLLPAMIDVIEAEDLPMGLYMVQTINLTDWRSADAKGLTKLAEAIEAQLGRRTTAKAVAPATSAPSPKAQTTLALIAIAAVVGGVAWFMLQQKPADPASAPAAQGQMIAETSTTPGPTCLDGSIPMLGVCANGASAIPPAPALGAPDTLTIRILRVWDWSGSSCPRGSAITREAGQLVFTTSGNRFVHDIVSETNKEIRTRVASCTSCDQSLVGNAYSLKPEYVGTDSQTYTFNLVVENLTQGTRDSWSPCP